MKKEEREIEKIIADDRHMRFGVCHLVSSPGNAFVCPLNYLLYRRIKSGKLSHVSQNEESY